MDVRASVASAWRLLIATPAIWAYGIALAALGWSGLPLALLLTGIRAPVNEDANIVRPALVVLALVALAAVLEVAAARGLAGRGGRPFAALRFAGGHVVSVVGFLAALLVTAAIFEFAAVSPLFTLGTSVGGAPGVLVALPFASFFTIAYSGLGGLALALPLLTLLPLGIRALAIGERTAVPAVLDGATIVEEGFGRVLPCFLLCAGLDLLLWGLGVRLGARELTATARLAGVTQWQGRGVAAGGVLLALTAVVATFKVALWTAVYQRVAGPLALDRPGTGEQLALPDSPRRSLALVASLARDALGTISTTPVLVVLAAVIAFCGIVGPVDLFALELFPTSHQTTALDLLPGGGPADALLTGALFVVALVGAAALLVATTWAAPGPPGGTPRALAEALRVGVRRLGAVLLAELYALGLLGFGGACVIVLLLFGMALAVQAIPGLEGAANLMEATVVLLTALLGALLIPFVARAVVCDGVRPRDALGRALTVAWRRPIAVGLTFVLTFALDILKGPLAARAGLVTAGWLVPVALVARRSLAAPPGWGALLGSVVLFGAAVAIVAFKAVLWTRLYQRAAVATGPASGDAPPVAPPRRARRRKPSGPRRPQPSPSP